MKDLCIGAWNVRTLLDADTNSCPERKTALIARELGRYNIDIAAISETHLSDSGELCEQLGGYTYYWHGKPACERASSGVGFAIRNQIARSLQEVPVGISDRLMTLKLQTSTMKFLHLISVYAPTLPSSEEDKNKFYQDLRSVLRKIPPSDKVVLLGDFNARVGTEYQIWKGILGRHGVGSCNANGLELLTLCAEFDLCITNTYFRLPEKLKTSWMHPRSKHWHLLDYVIVRKKDVKDVLITRAMRGAQGWTDHRLIRSKLRITLKASRRTMRTPIRLDASKLVHNKQLGKDLDAAFGTVPSYSGEASIDAQWRGFAAKLYETSLSIIGKPSKKNQDWFDNTDPEIMRLVEEYRRGLRSTSNARDTRAAQRLLKARVREQKDRWWADKAKELQHFADTNQMGKFFESVQAVFGPKCRKTAPIYSRDKERRLTNQKDVLERWAEHFNDVLNPEMQSVDMTYVDTLKNRPISDELASPPDFSEYIMALRKLKNNKTPGTDSLPSEIYKYSGSNINNRLYELVLKVWESETVPQDWKDASICKLYKGKGQFSDCSSYRGISLLSTAGKILAHILNTRLSRLAEQVLPESQCGFRPYRGTVDAIFVVKQIQEKSLEQNRPLYMCFVDLEKAFDRVPREALWRVLHKTGCPEKFVNLIRQFHVDMMAKVRHENEFSEPFPVTSGVKQGCVLAPTLFALYFSAVLEDALLSCHGRIKLNIRSDKSVFDLSRFKAKQKIQQLPLLDVLYADDVCLMADSMEALQSYMDALSLSCRRFGLVISISKTQVLKQLPRDSGADPTDLTIDGKPLMEVSTFKYLGSQIRKDNRLASEIPTRIARAAAAFGRLTHRVWGSHDLKLSTKLSVYRALVLPILLYASETWCLYKGDIRLLDTFHLRCLRSILHVKWQDRIPNTEILRRCKVSGMEALLMKGQLRWCGHVWRMEDCRLPKAVFYSELSAGKRNRGGQYLRYKDMLKRHLHACNIPTDKWEDFASMRPEWRFRVKSGVKDFEDARLIDLDTKRHERKSRPKPSYNYTYNSSGQLHCAQCDRVFRNKFGFASHIRAHARNDS